MDIVLLISQAATVAVGAVSLYLLGNEIRRRRVRRARRARRVERVRRLLLERRGSAPAR